MTDELFNQSIEGSENREGARLNVVTFTGNDTLIETARRAAYAFDANIFVDEDAGRANVFLAEFPDLTQEQATTIATVVRESGFKQAGTCYAAVRYDTGPQNHVDYLVAFE